MSLGVLIGFLFGAFLIPQTMGNADLVQVAAGNSQFANKFYSIISKEETGNVFFSPISAHTVLAMAYQGAAGGTADSFASTLNVPNQKVAASGYNGVMGALNSVENVTLHIANKIYIMKDFPLKDTFKAAVTEQFLSETEPVNFADGTKTAGMINQWVEKKTNSKIKDLIQPADLGALTRLVLVNAVYFKGNWAHQFSKDRTRTEPFYVSNDDKVDCQMMHITKRFNYFEDEALDAKILEMKYTNDNVSMVIVLPNARDGIANLEKKLETVDLSTLTNKMRNVEVEVSLPKFKIETSMDLESVLTKMGLGVIFSPNANFSEISESPEPLYVSKAIQKAFIEVNEEGAEAAAATAIVMAETCCFSLKKVQNIEFIADHPFIMLLLNESDGNPVYLLFYGGIKTPKSVLMLRGCSAGGRVPKKFEFLADHPFMLLLHWKSEDEDFILFSGRMENSSSK